MKKLLVLLVMGCIVCDRSSAQSYEVQQLLLDWTKLTQMKQILSDLKTGYQILDKGYTVIKDISQGNFNLHEAFLDGLWLISPAVRKYWKIPEIINYQTSLVKEYKTAYNNFKQGGYFNPDEILYMAQVYNNLINKSVNNLTDLTNIITANKLRMGDDERLAGIDKIYEDMQDMLTFLRSFNNQTSVLALQRAKEQNDVRVMRELVK